MNKYIQDEIRNNLRSVTSTLTLPQKKAISEVVRGLFTAGRPILAHLAQDETKSTKKQSEKYSYHLGRTDLTQSVKALALRKARQNITKTTIIAYDLTDINKECSRKMEKIRRVFDGSKRSSANGFELHGVGINGILTCLEVHDDERYTRNQTRLRIIREISEGLAGKGIWVFDRGNDDKAFFKILRQRLALEFIARLKENRQVVVIKTGEIMKVKDIPEGKYEVYLMNRWNTKADPTNPYTLIIKNHLEGKKPIRLISSLEASKYSEEQFITMYLERWGVENIFKRIKVKFELEKVRVFHYKRFINLIALIQLAVVISTTLFYKLQKSTQALLTGILSLYKKFIHLKSLTLNIDSFISYMRSSLEPLIIRRKPPSPQLSLFSRRQVEKLGMI